MDNQSSYHSRHYLVLALIGLAFLGLRVPLMYRQPGGLDEDWYSVPGWTVAYEGIPRVPYAPSRDPGWAFYRVDEAFMGRPPAYFCWQAPFFLLLPAGYGTARLASAVAGLIVVWLVYRLGRAFYQDATAGLWAAGLYSVSRAFYFPAQTARPDMLCAAFGLAALLATWQWRISGRRRYLAMAGALVGLGALTHPVALVYALQVGGWVLVSGRGLRGRLAAAAILVACTLATLTIWLPLIVAYPDIFRVQFFTNVLDRVSPGLVGRFFIPWPWLLHQGKILLELVQPIQLALMFVGLVGATLVGLRHRESGQRTAAALAWSSVYLLAVCEGPHWIKGYWCYPAALLFVCLGSTITVVSRWTLRPIPPVIWRAGVALTLLAAMVPGSGIRTWLFHIQHWSEIEYNAPRFAKKLLSDLPRDARLTVDPAFVLDAFLDGRRTILGVCDEFIFDAADIPYDYLIVGRRGIDRHVPERLNGEFVRAYGNRDDVFACYAELYKPKVRPASEPAQVIDP